MFRLLFLLSAVFTVSLCNFNKSFVEIVRNKRQINQNYECGVQYSGKGLISGGNEIVRGEFPW